jgi:pimeloyl-ACP methyl ester carboxylesterase
MYCHGYGQGLPAGQPPFNPRIKVFVDMGYAMAQSAYSAPGWAVKEAMEDTENLRQYFARKYGKPKRTFVTGHSLGGITTLGIIETYPAQYDAAMPICGPLEPSLIGLKKRVFDTLVVFDYYYPGVIGSPVKISDTLTADSLKAAIDADPKKREAVRRWMELNTEGEVAGVVGFFAAIQKELIGRAGGNAFSNEDTIYFGTDDNVALNRGVKRYAADPAATEYMRHYYAPSGRLVRPTLALHTVYDQLVPSWASNAYDEMVQQRGSSRYYVKRFVTHPGHCAVTGDETRHAFEDLVTWMESGKRPAAGEQK